MDKNMFKLHVFFRKKNENELIRYNVVEKIEDECFKILHADFIREGEDYDTHFFQNLSHERMLSICSKKTKWFGSIGDAILAHDKEFGN